jgi:LEA14-like dessication related protein
MKRFLAVLALIPLTLLGPACANRIKAPTLQIEGLHLEKVRLQGVGMGVNFRVRNVNPEELIIEKFEYELKVNGHRLGRGYHPNSVRVSGFGDEKLASRFDINFLALPGTVKNVLDRDRVKANAKGAFYVRRADGSLKKLKFHSDASVNLNR